MNKSERSDPRHKGTPLPGDDDLDFVLDDGNTDVEIDLDLPDWPTSSGGVRTSDTDVLDPGVTPARAASIKPSSKSDEFESLMDGLESDYDLPLPSKASAKPAPKSPADSPKPERASSGKTPRDAGPAATRKPQQPQAAPASPTPAGDHGARPTKRTVASQEKPPGQAKTAAKSAAKTAAEPAANGERKRLAAGTRAGGGPAAAKPTAPQSAARAAADQADSKRGAPTAPDLPGLPDDPGYDIISSETPASATMPAARSPAASAVASEPVKRQPRRKVAIKALLGVAVVTCLACGAIALYAGWFGGDAGSSEYEAIRARAAARSRAEAAAQEPAPGPAAPPAPRGPAQAQTAAPAVAAPTAADAVVEIGIAYGTEKRNWLEWAAGQFAATDEGRRIQVRLIPMGSLEGAHAVLDGDKRIHVWSPASSLYREAFVRDWEAKFQGNPILKEEALALTPMVLVMWKSRYEAFTAKSPEVSLRTIWFAMQAREGWATIAGKPQWGRFKFGHTHPNQSNSGLMTLIVLAYSFLDKTAGLTVREIMEPQFQDYLTQFNVGVFQLSNSTGNLMKDMALKGPTSYDALMVYESVAIDYLESAEGRWEPLHVVYPKQNLWNENPYCILNTPWTTEAHQKAAKTFLKYLLSEPIQARALDHGFRPANPDIPVKGPDSPFAKFADHGLAIELQEVCEVPSREVIENLQQMWIRTSAPRDLNGP